MQRPPWEAEELEAFAAERTRAAAVGMTPPSPPPPTTRPSRTTGFWSLMLALVPAAIAAVAFAIGLVQLMLPHEPWAGLGAIIIGYGIGAVATLVCFPLAIVLGISAIRNRRGAGLGTAGISIAGGILLLVGGNLLISVVGPHVANH
jgi:hypothetical protein